MLINARPIRMLIEAAEACAIDIEPMLPMVGIDRAALQSDENCVPWSMCARLCAEISASVGGDPERLRAIGRAMHHVPAYAPLRRVARTVISVKMLFDITARWFARANFPHLRTFLRYEQNDRLFIHGIIPSSYEAAEAFLQISAGAMASTSVLLGHPPCVIVEARVDGHSLDLELILPPSPSVLSAGFSALSFVVRRSERAELLENERRVLDAGLNASLRAHDELRTVLERMPALVVIHVDGRIVFANRALVKLLGWTRAEDLIGRPLLESIDPRSQAGFIARAQLPTGSGPSDDDVTEAWLVTREGDSVLIEVSRAQSITIDGAEARLVVGRDVNERDRLQKQLATADRLAALGLLAAGVAHEVNNPLAYLLNNIEIANKQLGHHGGVEGNRADVARSALQIALEGAHRIGFIVRELLLLAREDPAPAASADLAAAVESTLALARVEIARTAKLVIDLEPVPFVRGSVPRIAQIVLNLVLNSLEAMRHRDATQNELTVRIRRAGESHVLLEIGDNGVGVTAPDADRIFLPFFTTKPAGRGTGLGLAVTQRLVAELGGEISFTSERNRGTTFRILFPFADENAIAMHHPRTN